MRRGGDLRFRPPGSGYVERVSESSDAPTGPLNPRGSSGPDAPAPPGGPQRGDAPQGSASPGGPDQTRTEPEGEAHAISTEGDRSIPEPASETEPTADGEIHAQTQTDQANEELQEENAESSLDQPSDGSGGE